MTREMEEKASSKGMGWRLSLCLTVGTGGLKAGYGIILAVRAGYSILLEGSGPK